MHDHLLKSHSFCWVLHTKWHPTEKTNNEDPCLTWPWKQVKWRSRSKQHRRCTSTSCRLWNTCMIIFWKVIAFVEYCTQSGTHLRRLIMKIHVWHDLGNSLYGGPSKQNRRCTSTSCGNYNAYMIISWKVIALAGPCTHTDCITNNCHGVLKSVAAA